MFTYPPFRVGVSSFGLKNANLGDLTFRIRRVEDVIGGTTFDVLLA